jgi:hypothetical protein
MNVENSNPLAARGFMELEALSARADSDIEPATYRITDWFDARRGVFTSGPVDRA